MFASLTYHTKTLSMMFVRSQGLMRGHGEVREEVKALRHRVCQVWIISVSRQFKISVNNPSTANMFPTKVGRCCFCVLHQKIRPDQSMGARTQVTSPRQLMLVTYFHIALYTKAKCLRKTLARDVCLFFTLYSRHHIIFFDTLESEYLISLKRHLILYRPPSTLSKKKKKKMKAADKTIHIN